MSPIVYRISVLLGAIWADVPVGTTLGLFWLLWALISGRFLLSRGAVCPALADGGLPAEAVRRSGAALAYGRWAIEPLVRAWQQVVPQEGCWQAHRYERFRPVACALVGFFRPRRSGCIGTPYQSEADTALPAIVLAVGAAVGAIGTVRFLLVRLLLQADSDAPREAALQRRACTQAGAVLQPDAVLVVDAGCGVAALLTAGGAPLCGAGRPPLHGQAACPGGLTRPGTPPRLWGTGPAVVPPPPREQHHRHASRCHRAVGGRHKEHPGPGLGQPGGVHQQAGRAGLSVCSHPCSTLSGTAGVGDNPTGVRLCALVSVPRPLAHRAAAPGRQAAAWCPPGVRLWGREPPPPAGVGPLGGQCLGVGGCYGSGSGHGLVGSALSSDLWAVTPGTVAREFWRDPRAGRRTTEKGVGDGASAQGCAGASASERRQNTSGQRPATAESCLI
jgi:hypothetical protein